MLVKITNSNTFEANAKRFSGADIAPGFAPSQEILLVDNGCNETSWKSITWLTKIILKTNSNIFEIRVNYILGLLSIVYFLNFGCKKFLFTNTI